MSEVIVSAKHKSVLLPYDTGVANIIHNAKPVTLRDSRYLAVPHSIEETKLLNNMGYEIPSPILSYYDWSGAPAFDTQQSTAAMLVSNTRAYVLNSIGTGKTRSSLFAYDYLRSIGMVKKMLVVCPLSTMSLVWERETFMYFSHLNCVSLHGTRAKREKLLRESDADILILNHDGVGIVQQKLLGHDIDIVLIDELAVYRNASTKRWKSLKPVVDKAKFAWGMTGEPTPNEPLDAWGQARMLTPKNVHYSKREFQRETMRQVSQFRWVPRDEAQQIVHDALQPAVRYTREDSFDMPPTTIGYREAAMQPDQKKLYRDMVNSFAVQVRDKKITAANEGVKISKLLQIASGFIYGQQSSVKVISSVPRFRLLLEMIEESDAKVIVFTPFKFSVKMLEEIVQRYYTVEAVSGETPKKERDRIFNLFQNSDNPQVIVAHPGCMAHGLTLTKADTVIWFAPIWSTEIYAQACGRITRAGQDKHTHILHIVGSPIEKKIYKRLESKQKCQGVLLDMFKESTE